MLTRDLSTFAPELPESVRSLIRRKIDRIEPEDRELLIAASVQGVEFEAVVVARSLGRDTAHVEERLEVLERYADAHSDSREDHAIALPPLGTVAR